MSLAWVAAGVRRRSWPRPRALAPASAQGETLGSPRGGGGTQSQRMGGTSPPTSPVGPCWHLAPSLALAAKKQPLERGCDAWGETEARCSPPAPRAAVMVQGGRKPPRGVMAAVPARHGGPGVPTSHQGEEWPRNPLPRQGWARGDTEALPCPHSGSGAVPGGESPGNGGMYLGPCSAGGGPWQQCPHPGSPQCHPDTPAGARPWWDPRLATGPPGSRPRGASSFPGPDAKGRSL